MRMLLAVEVPGQEGHPDTWCCSDCAFLLTEIMESDHGVQTCALFGLTDSEGTAEELQIVFEMDKGARIQPCAQCVAAREATAKGSDGKRDKKSKVR